MSLILLVIFAALVFTYINGFHDTANSIATVVSTKVLTPRQAIVMAAVTNLVGAFCGTAVAVTIASGLVDAQVATMPVLSCALFAAIAWNLITWWFGLPSSSSHALVGGLCGSVLAASGNRWSSIIWSIPGKQHWWQGKGILWKIIVPMLTSPLVGFVGGFVLMTLLYFLLRNWRPVTVNRVFGKLQLCSAAYMGFAHGTNDAQKTMGIIDLDQDSLRADHVRRHRGRGLAHHQDAGPENGQDPSRPGFRRRNDRGQRIVCRRVFWHAGLHNSRHHHLHHGSWLRQTF